MVLGKVYPEFNFCGQCYNSTIVDNVYITYEDCKEECERLDESIFLHSVALLMIDDDITSKIDNKKKEYNRKNKYYLELEKELKELTSDMKVNYPVKTLQKVLK